MWYNVDFRKLVILLTPTFLRKTKIISFLFCLVEPVASLHYQWKIKRDFDWYRINHNGQKCKLRKVLNDNLDPIERRIIIEDGTSYPRKYIYKQNENKPVYLGKTFIKSNLEYENTGVDFIVYAPNQIISSSIYTLKYLIDYYKIAGKRYKIEQL